MADKTQLKFVYSSTDEYNDTSNTTKTVTIGDTAADSDYVNFVNSLGTLVTAYSLVSLAKVETTVINGSDAALKDGNDN